jgi:molybdopterin molybdotransferase
MQNRQLMREFIGYNEALDLTLTHVAVGQAEVMPLDRLTGRVLAEDVLALVDCHSLSTSRKDGYAVIAADLARASEANPVTLAVVGHLSAGDRRELTITSGHTVRVTTGAPLPEGADAVLSEEFCRPQTDKITAFNTAEAGPTLSTPVLKSTLTSSAFTRPAWKAPCCPWPQKRP